MSTAFGISAKENTLGDLVAYSYEAGKHLLATRSPETIKEQGQFLTPPIVARYMAKQLGPIQNGAKLLEPAVGSGVLITAIIERLIAEPAITELWVDAYEIDADLCNISRQVLEQAADIISRLGIALHWHVYHEDFILACLPEKQPSFFPDPDNRRKAFDYVISNPPYFKLNSNDKRTKAVSGKLKGHTNIYTLFISLCTKMLSEGGKGCFIVPRSFCSGAYFAPFRQAFLKEAFPYAFHLFQSRDIVFASDQVLQENIIFAFEKSNKTSKSDYWPGTVTISTSQNEIGLENSPVSRQVPFHLFLNRKMGHLYFRLPTGVLDEQILSDLDHWDGSLNRYGLQVSTGPVVSFRAEHLLKQDLSTEPNTVPLLWMQHVRPYQIHWPLTDFDKPQAISIQQPALLVPAANYVLLRRFSAKEDRRRLIAAPLLAQSFPYPWIGLENHLNFIYRLKGELQTAEALGLSAVLNSALIDRYFRIVNGNTQVNATELRTLPLPPIEVIRQIGEKLISSPDQSAEIVESIVFTYLRDAGLLSDDFPMIQETRITMGKIEQAHEILESFGLPTAQQNEMAALTLLVLAQLSEDTPWEQATGHVMRVHDILMKIKQRYGREYAENTRETVRRQVLHQFEQAGVVIRNPQDPTLATNSPRTHYLLTEIVLIALRAFGTPDWKNKRNEFYNQRGALLEVYQKVYDQNKIPLRVSDGTIFILSPGKHNQLQAAIVEEFGPRFGFTR
jgi:adenine-specific DNA-methyltransferase